jgi:hypothetical protein
MQREKLLVNKKTLSLFKEVDIVRTNKISCGRIEKMFEFQLNTKRGYSNIIRKNGNRYQICFSHTFLSRNYTEYVYYLMENGYTIRCISYEEADDNEFSKKKWKRKF